MISTKDFISNMYNYTIREKRIHKYKIDSLKLFLNIQNKNFIVDEFFFLYALQV